VHRRAYAAARFGGEAIVSRKAVKSELQHHLGRARGPSAIALDVGKAFDEAADN
jgi:hypothetical protein